MSLVAFARKAPWTLISLLSLTFGISTLVAAYHLSIPDTTGWPWNTKFSDGDPATVRLTHDDGLVETFTGTPERARAWLDNRQAALRKHYSLDIKVEIGHALAWAGAALIMLSGLIPGVRLFARKRAGSSM